MLFSPLGKGCGPLFSQTWIPFKKGCLVLAKCFSLEKEIYSLEKGMSFHLNTFESSSHKDALHQVWLKFGWNWLSGSGEEDENVKSLETVERYKTWCYSTNIITFNLLFFALNFLIFLFQCYDFKHNCTVYVFAYISNFCHFHKILWPIQSSNSNFAANLIKIYQSWSNLK